LVRRGTKHVFAVRSAARPSIRAASRKKTEILCVIDATISCMARQAVDTPYWERRAVEMWLSDCIYIEEKML